MNHYRNVIKKLETLNIETFETLSKNAQEKSSKERKINN